jgi:hypothetical protein
VAFVSLTLSNFKKFDRIEAAACSEKSFRKRERERAFLRGRNQICFPYALLPKEFHHQNVVVIPPAVLQRVDLMAAFDKACLGIEPARGFVLGYDGELKLLDMAGHMRHGGIDEAFADAVLAGFTPPPLLAGKLTDPVRVVSAIRE